MTTLTDPDALLALARQVAPTWLPRQVPALPPATFAVLYTSPADVWDRMLSANSPDRRTVHRLVCIGTTQMAARKLADAMVDGIDGVPFEESAWIVLDRPSDPIEDRTDPSAPSWSSTVEIHHYTRRS